MAHHGQPARSARPAGRSWVCLRDRPGSARTSKACGPSPCWPSSCFTPRCPGSAAGSSAWTFSFVISGFLITGLLWREVSNAGTVRLRRFYGARARRLLPASATVVWSSPRSARRVLLPPLEARTVLGDGIASALYVGNYRFALQGIDYFAAACLTVAVSALLVAGRRGAVLPGVASLDHRDGLAHPACASAHRGHAAHRPPIPGGPCRWSRQRRSRCRWWPLTCSPPVAFFSLPTRAWELAVGGLVAFTAARWRRLPALACRGRRMGRARRDPAGLHPLGTGHRLSGHRRAVAGAGHRAGDRRRLCRHRASGSRARPRIAADAGRRAGVVFLVSVALAGAAADADVLGHRAGLAAALAASLISGGLAVLTLRLIENPLRFAASDTPLGRGAVWRWAVPSPRSRSAWAWRCWWWCPSRSAAGRRLRAADDHRRASPHGPRRRPVRRRGASRRSRKCQAAVAASAEPESRSVEPDPAACRRGSRKTARCSLNGCVRIVLRSRPA